MSLVDLERVLAPVSESQPCGPIDFEHEMPFKAFLNAIEAGVQAAAEPSKKHDWVSLIVEGCALFASIKHLRLANGLLIALTYEHGVHGLALGLKLIRRLLGEQWVHVHPMLDAEDDNDHTERANTINDLAKLDGFLRVLWQVPLVETKKIGRVTWRDCLIADGRMHAVGGVQPMQKALIEACFTDTKLERLEECSVQLQEAMGELAQIEALFKENLPRKDPQKASEKLPKLNLEPLTDALMRMSRPFVNEIKARVALAGPAHVESTDLTVSATGAVRPMQSGTITSRQDVIGVLDSICEFYRTNEPSSPVPILLQRAKRLVNAGFADIIRDLTPQAMEQLQVFVGTPDETSTPATS